MALAQDRKRAARAIREAERERMRLVATGAELERQHAARQLMWRVAFALLWDNVALVVSLAWSVRTNEWPDARWDSFAMFLDTVQYAERPTP